MVDTGTTAKKAYELEMALALVGARHLCVSIRPTGNAGNHGYDWIVRMAGPTGSYYENRRFEFCFKFLPSSLDQPVRPVPTTIFAKCIAKGPIFYPNMVDDKEVHMGRFFNGQLSSALIFTVLTAPPKYADSDHTRHLGRNTPLDSLVTPMDAPITAQEEEVLRSLDMLIPDVVAALTKVFPPKLQEQVPTQQMPSAPAETRKGMKNMNKKSSKAKAKGEDVTVECCKAKLICPRAEDWYKNRVAYEMLRSDRAFSGHAARVYPFKKTNDYWACVKNTAIRLVPSSTEQRRFLAALNMQSSVLTKARKPIEAVDPKFRSVHQNSLWESMTSNISKLAIERTILENKIEADDKQARSHTAIVREMEQYPERHDINSVILRFCFEQKISTETRNGLVKATEDIYGFQREHHLMINFSGRFPRA